MIGLLPSSHSLLALVVNLKTSASKPSSPSPPHSSSFNTEDHGESLIERIFNEASVLRGKSRLRGNLNFNLLIFIVLGTGV